MADCNLSAKLGPTTYTLPGAATSTVLTDLGLALRWKYPAATTDEQAVLAYLLDVKRKAQELIQAHKQTLAHNAHVAPIGLPEIT